MDFVVFSQNKNRLVVDLEFYVKGYKFHIKINLNTLLYYFNLPKKKKKNFDLGAFSMKSRKVISF